MTTVLTSKLRTGPNPRTLGEPAIGLFRLALPHLLPPLARSTQVASSLSTADGNTRKRLSSLWRPRVHVQHGRGGIRRNA